MDFRDFLGTFAKVTFSLLCAGVFYFGWLAAILLTVDWDNPIIRAIGWLSAPLVTAMGFAAGIAIFERLTKTGRDRFVRIFIWSFIGSAIGAGVVYWFGPMLIVLGMFAAGTASVTLREVVLIIKRHKSYINPKK